MLITDSTLRYISLTTLYPTHARLCSLFRYAVYDDVLYIELRIHVTQSYRRYLVTCALVTDYEEEEAPPPTQGVFR